jgi:hypothetical protein
MLLYNSKGHASIIARLHSPLYKEQSAEDLITLSYKSNFGGKEKEMEREKYTGAINGLHIRLCFQGWAFKWNRARNKSKMSKFSIKVIKLKFVIFMMRL